MFNEKQKCLVDFAQNNILSGLSDKKGIYFIRIQNPEPRRQSVFGSLLLDLFNLYICFLRNMSFV